jgi:lysophospholipase L1-like esterase
VKRGYAIAGAALGAGILYLATRKASTAPSKVPGPRVILAIGDSLTASKDYCEELSKLAAAGSTVSCRGLPGKGTGNIMSDLRVQYPPAALAKFTDVIVLAGVNDIASGRSIATIEHNLTTIYNYIRKAGPRIVAVQLTPWHSYRYREDWDASTREVNNWIKSASVDAVVETFHLGDFQGRLLESYTSGDGLHLNKAGSQKLAALVMTQGF